MLGDERIERPGQRISGLSERTHCDGGLDCIAGNRRHVHKRRSSGCMDMRQAYACTSASRDTEGDRQRLFAKRRTVERH
jgi:hypothetical protein